MLSGHVLYRTMLVLLLRRANLGFPIIGLAARAVVLGLLELSRKSELSADRAGLLAVQSPEAALSSFLALAGGGEPEETDLNEFLIQRGGVRKSGNLADTAFKILKLLGTTHPFHVLRTADPRDWIEAGEYNRILRGEYRRRIDEEGPYTEDLAAGAHAYKGDAQSLFDHVGDADRRVRNPFAGSFGAQ